MWIQVLSNPVLQWYLKKTPVYATSCSFLPLFLSLFTFSILFSPTPDTLAGVLPSKPSLNTPTAVHLSPRALRSLFIPSLSHVSSVFVNPNSPTIGSMNGDYIYVFYFFFNFTFSCTIKMELTLMILLQETTY